MYYGETGEELKKFNTRDGLGLRFAREAGIKTAVLTSEDTYVVARRAEKLGVDIVRQGVQDKLSVMRQICEDTGIPLRDVAFVGDEINDVELLSSVGFAACPADAAPEVKAVSGIYIASVAGGDGVLREVSRIIACASDYRVRH
jgi:N-acylneuraminate cytidylyltransferase